MEETERSEFKTVRVQSNADISVFGMTSVTGSCDGFLALPVDGLGTEYFTVSYFPPAHKTQLGIAAVYNDTLVNVTLRLDTRPGIYINSSGIYTNSNGTVYMNSRGHNVIQLRLNAGEAVQLQDNSDLTGTRIASDRPIAVFSGNDFTQVRGNAMSPINASHLVEQIPPVDDWGSTFYVAPLPENANGYLLKVVASSSAGATTVVFADTDTPGTTATTSIQLNNPGDFGSFSFSGRSFVTVTATSPVLLVQLGLSTDATSPTMAIVPPAERCRSEYGFSTGENNSTRHYVTLVVANRSAVVGNLRLDGEELNEEKITWTQFPNNSQMIGASIQIGAGVHAVTQLDGVPFAAYVYGRSVYGCAYSYPAGFCLKSASEVGPISNVRSLPFTSR